MQPNTCHNAAGCCCCCFLVSLSLLSLCLAVSRSLCLCPAVSSSERRRSQTWVEATPRKRGSHELKIRTSAAPPAVGQRHVLTWGGVGDCGGERSCACVRVCVCQQDCRVEGVLCTHRPSRTFRAAMAASKSDECGLRAQQQQHGSNTALAAATQHLEGQRSSTAATRQQTQHLQQQTQHPTGKRISGTALAGAAGGWWWWWWWCGRGGGVAVVVWPGPHTMLATVCPVA